MRFSHHAIYKLIFSLICECFFLKIRITFDYAGSKIYKPFVINRKYARGI